MPLDLVKDHISRELVEALKQLLHGAEAGQITGIAFAVALKNRRYLTNVAGTCYREPTIARGMVAALDDELSEIVRGRTEAEIR